MSDETLEEHKDDDIAVLRLVTGETVISRVVEENDDMIVLYKPLSITPTYNASGEVRLAYRLWMPYTRESIVVVRKNAMVALCIASKYYKGNYFASLEELDDIKKAFEDDESDSTTEAKADSKEEKLKNLRKEDNIIFLNPDKNTVH